VRLFGSMEGKVMGGKEYEIKNLNFKMNTTGDS
jgi:hypothetical protein